MVVKENILSLDEQTQTFSQQERLFSSTLKDERASPVSACQIEISFILHHGSLEEIMLLRSLQNKLSTLKLERIAHTPLTPICFYLCQVHQIL